MSTKEVLKEDRVSPIRLAYGKRVRYYINKIADIVGTNNLYIVKAKEWAKNISVRKSAETNISAMLSALVLTSYAASDYISRVIYAENTELTPFTTFVRPQTIPPSIRDAILDYVASYTIIKLQTILAKLEKRESFVFYDMIPPFIYETLATLYVNYHDIEKAVREFNKMDKILEKYTSEYYAPQYEFVLSANLQYKLRVRYPYELVIVNTRFKGKLSFNDFSKLLQKLQYNIKYEQLAKTKIVVGTKSFNTTEILISYGSDRNGFMVLRSFTSIKPVDLPIRGGEPIAYYNVTLKPLTVTDNQHISVVPEVRKVQRLGKKLALYLTEPLRMIGVDVGDVVEILIDRENGEIIIRKPNRDI